MFSYENRTKGKKLGAIHHGRHEEIQGESIHLERTGLLSRNPVLVCEDFIFLVYIFSN